MYSLVESRESVNKWMERYGVRFGIYKNGTFKEQLFPFDPIPRVISPEEWEYLEKGLAQRVKALNMFLADIYGEKKIVKDGIVPEAFIYASKGYLPQCEGIRPPHDVYAHISGIDLVQALDGSWFVLEDNLRIPSGASYPLIARTVTRKVSPETFTANHIEDNRDYPALLKHMM
ncbi:MAG: circularly permuted type 2 ATP-grasp protein, partial [Mailhella sp.]|nr:circularly permuted type 2 ATP-grasp protein [Mailhella sp.]